MTLNFKDLSVLVVEDTVPMRKLMCSVLETLGIGKVFSASNGKDGFKLFQQHSPDIIVADWMMEPVSGIELTKLIRNNADSTNRLAPIILVTGYSAIVRVAEARDAGVTELLIKPFSASDLANRISYVINRPRDFIDYESYFGPDRRRHKSSDYNGPLRRTEDDKD